MATLYRDDREHGDDDRNNANSHGRTSRKAKFRAVKPCAFARANARRIEETRRVTERLGHPQIIRSRWSLQVEAIQIHDLGPSSHEVMNELRLPITRSIDLGQ